MTLSDVRSHIHTGSPKVCFTVALHMEQTVEAQDWLEKVSATVFLALLTFYLIDFYSTARHQKIREFLMNCCTKPKPSEPVPCLFPQFSELPKEVQISVLSFVADMPCENDDMIPNCSTVTHTLPLVSKSFRQMAYSDSIWNTGLYRMALKEPSLWVAGLVKLLPNDVDPNATDFLETARERSGLGSCMEVYERVLNTAVRFKGLMFHMRGNVGLDEPFGLHFFEPRYRRLIRTVMHRYPAPYVNGEPIDPSSPALDGLPPPLFVYANSSTESRSSAVIVRVQKCVINPSGTADVLLVPVAHVWLESIWPDQPHTGDLLYAAQVMRMPKAHSDRMENMRRRNVMTEQEFFDFIIRNGAGTGLDRRALAHVAQIFGAEFRRGAQGMDESDDDDEDD